MKILILTLGLAALAAPVAAADFSAPARFEKTVSVGDLDLQTAAGADALIGRLEVAARSACRGQPLFEQHFGAIRERACAAKAVAAAAARLDAPLVSAGLRAKLSPVLLAKQ